MPPFTDRVLAKLCTHALPRSMLLRTAQVLPDAVHRGGHGYNDSFFAGEIQPIRAPLDSLFDVDHLVEWGASVGAVLHTVRRPRHAAHECRLSHGSAARSLSLVSRSNP